MKKKEKHVYECPLTEEVKVEQEGAICTISGQGVRLLGAGVDETEAEDNGSNIW